MLIEVTNGTTTHTHPNTHKWHVDDQRCLHILGAAKAGNVASYNHDMWDRVREAGDTPTENVGIDVSNAYKPSGDWRQAGADTKRDHRFDIPANEFTD